MHLDVLRYSRNLVKAQILTGAEIASGINNGPEVSSIFGNSCTLLCNLNQYSCSFQKTHMFRVKIAITS